MTDKTMTGHEAQIICDQLSDEKRTQWAVLDFYEHHRRWRGRDQVSWLFELTVRRAFLPVAVAILDRLGHGRRPVKQVRHDGSGCAVAREKTEVVGRRAAKEK